MSSTGRSKQPGRRNRRAAITVGTVSLVLVLATVSLLMWSDIRDWLREPAPTGVSGTINTIVEQASAICLADVQTSASNEVQLGLTARLSNIGSQGKVTRQQVRRSVNIAVNDEVLLLSERDRVRECIDREVTRLLQVHGLLAGERAEKRP